MARTVNFISNKVTFNRIYDAVTKVTVEMLQSYYITRVEKNISVFFISKLRNFCNNVTLIVEMALYRCNIDVTLCNIKSTSEVIRRF